MITRRHQFRYFDKICCCKWKKKIAILGQRKFWLICYRFPIDSSNFNNATLVRQLKMSK